MYIWIQVNVFQLFVETYFVPYMPITSEYELPVIIVITCISFYMFTRMKNIIYLSSISFLKFVQYILTV